MNPFSWYTTGTGGGNDALRCDLTIGGVQHYALITDGNQCAPDDATEAGEWDVGLYVGEDEPNASDTPIAIADGFSSREECEAWLVERIAK